MPFSETYKSNAYSPMRVTFWGISMLFSELHPSNVPSPIEVTPLGIVTFLSEWHLSKTMVSMAVTLSGKRVPVSSVQCQKAAPIVSVLSRTVILR